MKTKLLKCTAVAFLVFILGVVIWGYFSYTNFLKEEYPTIDGISYEKVTVIHNGVRSEEFEVVGCTEDIKILKIAPYVNGFPVTGFGKLAFQDNTIIEELILPDTMTSIPMEGAPFSGCTNIKKITLATDDVGYLFGGGRSNNNPNFEPLPESLKCIVLTDACTSIDARSFRNCKYLEELYIPASVTEIDDGSGTTIIGVNGHIPSSAASFLPFWGCENLTIYCEAESEPDGWGASWNYISEDTRAKTVWGYDGNYDPSLAGSGTLYFETDGGSRVSATAAHSLTAAPVTEKEGYLFAGWYYDEELTLLAEFPLKNKFDLTLYAKWLDLYEIQYYNGVSIQYSKEEEYCRSAELVPEEIDLRALAELGYSIEITVTYTVKYEKDYEGANYSGPPEYTISLLQSDGTWIMKNTSAPAEWETRTISTTWSASSMIYDKPILKYYTYDTQNIIYFPRVNVTYRCYK